MERERPGERTTGRTEKREWVATHPGAVERTTGAPGGTEWAVKHANRWPDRAIGAIATGQHGLIKHQQLVALGLGRGAIEHSLGRGRLIPIHRGIYAVAHTALPPLAHQCAAVLACGGSALLSHQSAAAVWGFRPPVDGEVHVIVVGSEGGRRRDGIRVHRITELDPRDRRLYENIPITSPARTLLDVAPTLSSRELELAFDEAIVRKLVTVRSVRAVLVRYPCRRGSASLAALADDSRPTTLTRSRGEEILHTLLRKARLAQPEVNARWRGYLIDFLWREQRVAIEVDGLKFHSTRAVLERDHRRDADLKDAGFEVIRITWRMLVDEPELVLVRLARALSGAQ